MSEEHPIHIELKDLLFTEAGLYLKRQENFGELPEESLVQGEEVVPRHLHSERGAATAFLSGQQ